MESTCLWTNTSPEPPFTARPLNGDCSADVAIIGGGITGLSTALHLTEFGTSVIVLEAGGIPSGGSGRNVGLVNAGMWIPPEDIADVLGAQNGERANSILDNGPAEVFALVDRYGIDCQDTRSGTLHLGHNRKGEAELARRFEQLQRRGAPVELLSGKACRDVLGTQRIGGALLDRRAGTVNPAAYTRGLARAAAAAGADIRIDAPVLGLSRSEDGWRLTTAQGRVSASKVVLATNAYTEDQWNEVRRHYFRGCFFQVASPPMPEDRAGDILPQRQGAWDTRTVLSSLRRDAAGRLILGSLGRGDGKPLAYLRSWATRIQRHYFPQLGQVDWECTWTGTIAFTPDHTLRLFEPAPGILAVSGYNGRGITTGTVVGKGFAHYIVHGDDALLPLPVRSAKPVRGRRLRSSAYEFGFSLYHAGQCLRILL
ncbi:MAG: FAD-binding oxidoreductase [Acidihalobacter sp.]